MTDLEYLSERLTISEPYITCKECNSCLNTTLLRGNVEHCSCNAVKVVRVPAGVIVEFPQETDKSRKRNYFLFEKEKKVPELQYNETLF